MYVESNKCWEVENLSAAVLKVEIVVCLRMAAIKLLKIDDNKQGWGKMTGSCGPE